MGGSIGSLRTDWWLSLTAKNESAEKHHRFSPSSGNIATRRWLTVFAAVFIGTFMGIWLQQISLKHTAAGIAQTLFATSPLFVIPIVAVMGEKISYRAILGALLATVGVVVLFGF